MTGEPIGGSRWTALLTMGPVWLRYSWMLVFPGALSLVHDVDALTTPTLTSALGYLVLLTWGGVGGWLFWRNRSAATSKPDAGAWLLASFLWFAIPLVPVSQVLFPLQNLMADRYLVFSVMAVALALGWLATAAARSAMLLASVCTLALGAGTLHRASLFADSLDVFADATNKTETSTLAPYQLAKAYEEHGMLAEAAVAYRIVLERDRDAGGAARRATNNLARLLVKHDQLEDAEQLLKRGIERWPEDPKMRLNLVKVLYRMNRTDEARQLYDDLRRRFPDYDPARPQGAERFISD
jgi:tetratricopeptide (TPR) repeat protein